MPNIQQDRQPEGWEATHHNKSKKKKSNNNKTTTPLRFQTSDKSQRTLSEMWNLSLGPNEERTTDNNNQINTNQANYGIAQGNQKQACRLDQVRVQSHNINGITQDRQSVKSLQCI